MIEFQSELNPYHQGEANHGANNGAEAFEVAKQAESYEQTQEKPDLPEHEASDGSIAGLAGASIRAYNDALLGAGRGPRIGGGRTSVPTCAEDRASHKSRKSHANGIRTEESLPEAA